ncbi:type VI secretion system secreted protein VgrG [Variovorax sp. OK605]|uniref:type VI secretion system Vgr family protein n=1 Tax=Variovorax sp. OK605 TaxID=1855317 RepID=UPI0008ED59E9|nr:type VI secretion system tip protein TssI/VgrG [Variovorax sp. OK605]SFQ55452.1 type VI secretion system secreted protein VgrG [Variovorax sp. OK605]
MTRSFIAHSALGERLKFRSMTGHERISTLFESRVRLVSDMAGIAPKRMLGEDMTVEVNLATELGGPGTRFISGQVTRFACVGKDDGDMCVYEATLRPWLWYATRRSDFRIFQFKTAPQILQEVLAPYGFAIDAKLGGNYRTWEYCVQYAETDFNFVSRLMEQEGIYYYFSHAMGSHQLVLCDGPDSHAPLPAGPVKVPYHAGVLAAQILEQDFIDSWSHGEDIAPGNFAADDYDFKKPNAEIDTLRRQPAGHSRDSFERYDWPGGYTELGDGENYARLRLEQLAGRRELITAEGNLRHMAPGYLFELARHPNAEDNRRYLIEAVSHDFQENALRVVGAADAAYSESTSSTSYRQTVDVLPDSAPYRPERATPRPRTTGPQTAVVVGPEGEEIHTDEYGRIKVQFHWDRYGRRDENSSCWIRVSQTWAGSNYGAMHIPRIGQEVIVDFLNGDPDHPIVTGCVYNAAQMPPWELPRHKTQTGFQTHWSKGGGGKHMLRFEDARGNEHIELSTDHGNTHLHMGYLMNQGSGVQRSYGFELRTNEWGSIRADKGLLLTTYTQDHAQKVSRDNPDGHEHMGATLAQSNALMQAAGQALASTKALVSSMAQGKNQQLMGLVQGVQSAGGVTQAIAALAAGGAPEAGVSDNPDPAMADAQQMLDLSRKIDKPVVSIVSPEGQTMISPKPIVVSSGQSVSMRSTSAMTLTTGAQLTQLVAGGMLTQVSEGGQVNVVSGGDIVSHASAGAINLVSKTDASVTSTDSNATVTGRKSVVIQAAEQDVFVTGKTSISLICGKSSIVLLADGTVKINGVKGLVNFTGDLDQRGGKIFLNCEAPVGSQGEEAAMEDAVPLEPAAAATSAEASQRSVPAAARSGYARTGLGRDVDAIAARSPTLQRQLKFLQGQGWKIGYGPAGGGTYANTNPGVKKIVIDSKDASDPYRSAASLSHEVGHAVYSYRFKPNVSSKSAFVTSMLSSEGEAALNQIQVQREVWRAAKVDILKGANPTNVAAFNEAYNGMVKGGTREAARAAAGEYYGTLHTSTTGEQYTQYYGNSYDKSHGGKH